MAITASHLMLCSKLASLSVGEFDLRLDEGMVRWAQGLADRVMWTLVADKRLDDMARWPLPEEAFCSPQVRSRFRSVPFMFVSFRFIPFRLFLLVLSIVAGLLLVLAGRVENWLIIFRVSMRDDPWRVHRRAKSA